MWNVSKAINPFCSDVRVVYRAGSLPGTAHGLHVDMGQPLVTANIRAQSMPNGTLAQAADLMELCATATASPALVPSTGSVLKLPCGRAPGPSVPSILCQSWVDNPKAMTVKDKKALDCVGPRTCTSKVIQCFISPPLSRYRNYPHLKQKAARRHTGKRSVPIT